MAIDDDKAALGLLGRQEILTALIAVVFGVIVVSAAATLFIVLTDPNIGNTIVVSGDVDIGAFVDKMVESYDAFLVLLGVGVGAGVGTAIASARSRGRNSGTQTGRDNDYKTYMGQINFLKNEMKNSEDERTTFASGTSDFDKMMTKLIDREISKTRRELVAKENYLQELMNRPGWWG